jgi:hypothetical protein
MTWLRHASRHVHHSVADYLRAQLDALNWTDEANTPFGAPAVDLRTSASIVGEKLVEGISAGVVTITLGPELAPEEEELGGPLSLQEYPFFIDIFQESEGVCTALACDIRDIFMGRLAGTQRWLPVTNQATDAVVAGWKLEFDDVERVTPDQRFTLPWQVVKVTASAYFPEVVY